MSATTSNGDVTAASCPLCGGPISAGSTCARCGATTAGGAAAARRQTGRQSMSEAEWTTLMFSPFWVFVAVAGADGTLDAKEVRALVRVVEGLEPTESELMGRVLADCALDLDGLIETHRKDPRTVDEGLSDVRHVLESRVDKQEARRFRKDLGSIGAFVARASGTGPFGSGQRMSTPEREAIDLVMSLLDNPPREGRRGL